METTNKRLLELQNSDHLIIYSVDEYDVVVLGNSALFPDGSTVHQRTKIKKHFDYDYTQRASAFSLCVSEITLSVEIFYTDAHKRSIPHMDCMVNVDGDVYSRGEMLNPKLCLPILEIDDLARKERVYSVLRRERSVSA